MGYWDQKLVLVTGAGGFIGSHLVTALIQRGARVRALVHYNSRADYGNLDLLPKDELQCVDVVMGDIQDAGCVHEAVRDCECVFHLAALIGIPYSYVAPRSYVATNIAGTLNVLEAVRSHQVPRMVHTSTSEAYGTAIYTPIDESHPLQGQSPYSASKIAADKLAESYHNSFGLPVATIRPFNTYGPRQSARAIIPAVISQLLSGKETVKLGALDPVRDLTYVEDTVRGFLAVGEQEAAIGQTINVGHGEGIAMGDLAEMLIRLVGRNVEIASSEDRLRPPNSEVMKLICNNTKAQQILGWQPTVSLEEGLERTVAFIRDNLKLYRTDGYAI